MHPITVDDPTVNALPHHGEHLINKTTGQRRAAAPTGSLLLTSVPFGWRGIIVEQQRLPPMELPEHSGEPDVYSDADFALQSVNVTARDRVSPMASIHHRISSIT